MLSFRIHMRVEHDAGNVRLRCYGNIDAEKPFSSIVDSNFQTEIFYFSFTTRCMIPKSFPFFMNSLTKSLQV